MPIDPPENPPIKPGQPSEPPQESPPGSPRPEVPPPVQDPWQPPQPEELPGRTPDEMPVRGPQGPTTPSAAIDTGNIQQAASSAASPSDAGRAASARAFSSEVETGSRQENASNRESRAPFRFNRSGKGSSRAGAVQNFDLK